MKEKRILFLTQYYLPEMGAPQARISELASRLSHRGYVVNVLTALPNYPTGKIYDNYRGKLFFREEIENIPVFRTWIYPSKSVSLMTRLFSYFSFVISSLLYGSFKLDRYDYIFVESPPLFLGITGRLLSIKLHSKVIFNVSDLWPDSALDMKLISKNWKYKISKYLELWCYNFADMITGQSEEIVKKIGIDGNFKKTFLLTNGVDTEKFTPENKNLDLIDKLGFKGGFIITYAGLIGMAQGLEQVVLIAEQLKEKKDIYFFIIGDGPMKEKLVGLKNDKGLNNVIFFDPMPKKQIANILASSNMALITLKERIYGAVPSKIYEAMASGLPILFIGEGGAKTIIDSNNCGKCVDSNDFDGAVAVINELYSAPNIRCQMGENGRIAVNRKYSRDSIADCLDELIMKLGEDNAS